MPTPHNYAPTLMGPSVPALPLVVQSGLAVLRIDGPMFMGGWWNDPEVIAATLDRAAADSAVRILLIDANCPGGSAFGTSDLEHAAKRFRASGKKLCVIAHDQCNSSMYWLASYANELVATHSAMVGSIGTIMTIYDDSQRYQQEGVRPVVIELPGIHKRVGMPGVPVTAEHEARLRQSLEVHQQAFRDAVAANRKLSPEAITNLGGASLIAKEALAAGLIDRIVDYREYVAQLTQEAANGPAQASAENLAPPLETPIMPEAQKPTATNAAPSALNMTEEEIRQKFPDLVASIEAKAKTAAKSEGMAPAEEEEEPAAPTENRRAAPAATNQAATIEELEALAPNDAKFVLDCHKAGMTLNMAKLVYERLPKAPANSAPAAGRGVERPLGVRPANGGDGPANFDQAVTLIMNRDHIKRGAAIKAAAREFRDLHEAYVENLRKPENQVQLMESGRGGQRATRADLASV